MREEFAGLLSALSLEEREALLLVVVEGFNYLQAARILKISRGVLIARLARARAKLGQRGVPQPPMQPARTRPSYLRVVK
jgi:RNA polymerase sigma-70 factor, ECF subfamily